MNIKLAALVLSLFTISAPLARSQAEYLLVIDGIAGESAEPGHSQAIELYSFSWGCENPTTQAGGGAGKVQFSDFRFSAKASKAGPQLLTACASGKRIPQAVLYVRNSSAGQPLETYLEIKLENVLVSSWATSASGGDAGDVVPTDQFSLNFGAIKFEYKPQNEAAITGQAQLAVQ